MLFPALAFAQDAGTATSTMGPGLGDLLNQVPAIVSAFQSGGLLAGLSAIAATLALAMNFGPLRALLANSKADWLRPLLMLISVGMTAGIAAAMAGGGWLTAVISGLVAGLGSGYLQKTIQEARD